jgi:hypothetical protein
MESGTKGISRVRADLSLANISIRVLGSKISIINMVYFFVQKKMAQAGFHMKEIGLWESWRE